MRESSGMGPPHNDSPNTPPPDRLAIDGGTPAVTFGSGTWPPDDPRIGDQLLAAWADGSWGRYESRFSEQLRAELQRLCGVQHVVLTCSGTFAVELALRALKVASGDEVVLAGYDFPGNFRAVEAVGAAPVLVDIDPGSCCLDPAALLAAIGAKTRAVIVSHLHGGLADMRGLTELARARGVAVVEDACQAPGALVQGRPAGSWGDVGVLSFGGSKLLTAGRGGALVTDDPRTEQRAKIYSQRGNDAFPLSELQAAVLLPQLDLLAQHNPQRARGAELLIESLGDLKLLRPLCPGRQPGTPAYYKVAFSYQATHAAGRSREQFIDALLAEGVTVGAGFRGFLRRGAKRCRAVGPLTHSAHAAQSMVLLHHPALLGPVDHIRTVAQAFRKVARYFEQPAQ